MGIYLKIFFCCLLLLTITFCKNKDKQEAGDGPIARVYNKTLLLSEVREMVPENASPEDSALMANAIIERWVRDNLMMHEAERNIPKDLNIDKLVADYRASLILNNYEQLITEQSIDSVITEQELNDFYEKNKDQYQLQTPIVRCFFIRIPKPTAQPDSLRKWWYSRKAQDLPNLVRYANRFANEYMLADTVWYRVEDIAAEMPKGTLTQENVRAGQEISLSNDDFQFFFRVLEVKYKKEIAPLAFIKDQATKFILHQRKIKMLENKKEELYQRESRRNNVKIY